MQTVEITIERRTERGKGPMRRLRAAGRVPAILYGPNRETAAIVCSHEQVERRLAHLEGSHLIRLVHAGGAADAEIHERMVLVRDMQRHPVTGAVLHADFFEVDLTERLRVSVPLHFVGKAAGVVAGGILQPVLREVEVECLPTEIPEFIEVDVSPLGIHDAIHAGDLKLPEGTSIAGDVTSTVVTVLPPTVEAAGGQGAAEGGEAGTEAKAESKKGGEGAG
ncbi:MAG: 50S ribosomal protein L25 [bacterium]|nr:50S ribosomal protein L25 [bacterium]